jgi:hypothetical protein
LSKALGTDITPLVSQNTFEVLLNAFDVPLEGNRRTGKGGLS